MSRFIIIDQLRHLYVYRGEGILTEVNAKDAHIKQVGTLPDVVIPAKECRNCGKTIMPDFPDWMHHTVKGVTKFCKDNRDYPCNYRKTPVPKHIPIRDWKAYRAGLAKRKALKQQKK
jgi:hypothetical protein